MVKTIATIGSSHGLMFDAALMDMAHLKAGGHVNVQVREGGTTTVAPLHPKPSREENTKAIKAAMKDCARTMKKLA